MNASHGWLAVMAGFTLVASTNCAATSGDATAPDGATVIATSRLGALTAQDYRSWLEHRDLDDDPELRAEVVRTLLTVRSLATDWRAARRADPPGLELTLATHEETWLVRSLRRDVAARLTISAEDVDAALQLRPDAFHKPERRKLLLISKDKPPGASETSLAERREAIEELRRRALAGEDFGELARHHSDSDTRYRFGRIGLVEPGELPPAVDGVVFALAEGAVSEVLEGDLALLLFKCEEILPPRAPDESEQRAKVASALRPQRFEAAWTELGARLREQTRVRIFPDRPLDPAAVLATVDDHPLRGDEVAATIEARRGRDLQNLAPGQLEAQIEALVQRRLLATEARRRGLDEAPELASSREWKRLEALALAELTRRVNERLERPTPEELAAHLALHQKRFSHPLRFEISVLRRLPQDAEPATIVNTRQQLDEALQSLEAGEISFTDLARELSEHPTAAEGGYVGWVERPWLSSRGVAVSRATEELVPGGTTAALHDEGAFWIVHLHARREPRPMTAAEAGPALEQHWGSLRTRNLQAEIEAEVADSLDVRVVD